MSSLRGGSVNLKPTTILLTVFRFFYEGGEF